MDIYYKVNDNVNEFTDVEGVKHLLCKDSFIQKVLIPISLKKVQKSQYIYTADKLILGKKENVFTLDNINKFNININLELLQYILHSKNINTELLNLFIKDYHIYLTSDKYYRNKIISYAAKHGKIDIFEWYSNNFSYNYFEYKKIILKVCKYGHINILDWLYNYNPLYLSFYNSDLLVESCISKYGYELYTWIYNKDIKLEYHEHLILTANIHSKGAYKWFMENKKIYPFAI